MQRAASIAAILAALIFSGNVGEPGSGHVADEANLITGKGPYAIDNSCTPHRFAQACRQRPPACEVVESFMDDGTRVTHRNAEIATNFVVVEARRVERVDELHCTGTASRLRLRMY